MLRPDVKLTKTGNTYDPQAKGLSWSGDADDPDEVGENQLRPGIWNRWGHGEVSEGQSCEDEVRGLFCKDQDIMRDEATPRNGFEARNQNALGLGRRSSGITNMIGDNAVSIVEDTTDERLGLMDADGNYIDGVWRG